MTNKKITIPLSEEDLDELRNGNSFDWNFDGIDVHLTMENNCEVCGEHEDEDGRCGCTNKDGK